MTAQPIPADPRSRLGAVGRVQGAQAGRTAAGVGTLAPRLAAVAVALAMALSTVVSALFPSTSMVWPGSQSLSVGVAVNVTVNVHSRGSFDYSEYRVSAGHSHGPPTAINAQFCREQTYYVLAGNTPVLVHNCNEYFRGAKPGEQPSFVPKPNEYKVDPATGFVKETHGVSVFDNAESVSSRGFVPHQLDMDTIPDSLRIIQRGADPKHFEIVPKPGANLTPDDFTAALCQIQCLRPGS